MISRMFCFSAFGNIMRRYKSRLMNQFTSSELCKRHFGEKTLSYDHIITLISSLQYDHKKYSAFAFLTFLQPATITSQSLASLPASVLMVLFSTDSILLIISLLRPSIPQGFLLGPRLFIMHTTLLHLLSFCEPSALSRHTQFLFSFHPPNFDTSMSTTHLENALKQITTWVITCF